MEIANTSNIPHIVALDRGEEKLEIRVMPKSKVSLPPGTTVNARWLAMNPRAIHVFKSQKTYPAQHTEEA